MSKKEKVFTTTLVLKVLYDNPLKSLSPEEISKEVVKEVGKETTILTTNDATELKRILDHLERNNYIHYYMKYKRIWEYKITFNGQSLHEQAQNLMLKDPTNPLIESTIEQYLNRDQNLYGVSSQERRDQEKKFQEETAHLDTLDPLDMNHQEKIAYYSSQEFSRQKYLSREEYKKNKKYIYKKGWGTNQIGYGGSIGETVGYKRITKAERKRSRFDWYVIFACMAIPIIIAIVVIYVL